jgi:hypothetical protein
MIDAMAFQGRIALCHADAEILYEVASLGKTYVEIGTLFGGSACIAGLAGCEVFCIDPLDGYYSAVHKEENRIDRISGLVPSVQIVKQNWESWGLDPAKLHIYAQMHPPWPQEIDREFDVGLIDGDHGFQGVQADYEGMAPRVKYLMFHDVNKAPVVLTWAIAVGSGVWEKYIPKTNTPRVLETLMRRSI